MECNRDEAARAKEIAEKKFEANDYLGAKKFSLKAHSLYPDLDGIQHMLTTLDIYISSENRVNGESDWYKVLNVNPHADEEAIRKQYRKLALRLHPDKNKSIGADGAFKLISEAWNLLSNKIKRSVYDQKRNIKVVTPIVPPHGSNGVRSSNKSSTTPKMGAQTGKGPKKKNTTSNGPTTAKPNQQKYPNNPTFWTVCHRCRLQHEYLCMYLHRNLVCPSCSSPYYAFEYPPPSPQILKMALQSNHFQQKQAEPMPWFSGSCSSNQMNSQWDPFSKTAGGPFDDQAATAAQQAFEKSKREREEALEAMRREREADLKRKFSASQGEAGSQPDSNAAKRRKVFEDPMSTKTQGAKMSSSPATRGKTKATVSVTENGKLNDPRKGNLKDSERLSIFAHDTNFYDFNKSRSENCFGKNQVWAVYDNNDGMPRYYTIIHEVVSVNPFKVWISWLNSKTNTELGPLNWVGSGFTKACGEFRPGIEEINESLNSFSHKVSWTMGKDGVVLVFPRRGDVWALYRNWSPKWNKLTGDKVIHEYDVVEVLEDYDEELGVRISPLIKVAGFKTIFRRHWDETEIKMIPREGIFRFSHQVPSFLLSGRYGENAPMGCYELDAAATPPPLLQVISDGKGENMMGDEGVILLD